MVSRANKKSAERNSERCKAFYFSQKFSSVGGIIAKYEDRISGITPDM
jgi:hypothetical protein